MYILKNAWVSIKKHKGRNLLIGIIVSIIACSAAISLAIRSSANELITSYENKYDTTATIGINRDNMKESMRPDSSSSSSKKSVDDMKDVFSEISNITTDQIKKYGTSSYVKSYYYTLTTGVNSSKLEKASSEKDNNKDEETKKDDSDSSNNKNDNRRGGPGGQFMNMTSGDFTLTGYSSVSAMEDFISGKYKITSGKVSTDLSSDTCVINSELATLNNIKVGDKITLTDPEKSSNTITLEVTGIYEEKDSGDEGMGMFTNSANNIITNTTAIEKLSSADDSLKISTTPTFVLKSKNDVDNFEKELHKKGLSSYLTINTNLEEVESATSSISNVKSFAIVFLIITLVIGAIILFVINIMNIRERKYEIGVLRAIGMKKRNITIQFVTELLIITFASLIIGTAAGAALSMPVSNSLLENEINSSKNQSEEVGKNFGGGPMKKMNGMQNIEAFKKVDAVVDIKVIGELFVVGIILTLVSSSSSMISIQRFSPLEILRERS